MPKNAYLVSALVATHALILLFFTSELSINYYEADLYFNEQNLLHYILHLFTAIFGQNDFALRLPMILMHTVGAFLYYDISKSMFKKPSDQVWGLIVYLLLPGVNSAAIMVDGAGLVLFLLLLFLFAHKHKRRFAYVLLPLYVFVDPSFAFLYLAFSFYAMEKRKTLLLFSSIGLFGVSMYLYGIEIGGHPTNYFLNTLGLYAAIFSPFMFIYMIYALYRTGLKEERNILWYLGATAFLFSLLLSFRQQMKLEELAPYLLVATPIMVKTFLSSYRIRLREFRRGYRILLALALGFLLFSTLMIYMNKVLYLFIPNPSKHFVYNNHVVKELANELKASGITALCTQDQRLQLRLRFYGINEDASTWLYTHKPFAVSRNVTIRYNNVKISEYYVTKLYKQ
ncbi:MAG: glycosyltransferase family 39 protein [Campylobacterales bacterium]|nr:glycosyltransferase family 39 protein [Campylobacterales bacterium]